MSSSENEGTHGIMSLTFCGVYLFEKAVMVGVPNA